VQKRGVFVTYKFKISYFADPKTNLKVRKTDPNWSALRRLFTQSFDYQAFEFLKRSNWYTYTRGSARWRRWRYI